MVSIENIQLGVVIYGFAALYAVMILSSAIVLFTSTLTKYPIFDVAAAVAIFSILYVSGRFFLGVPVIEYIATWLSFPHRAQNIYVGYIVSRDLAYFALLIGLFVFLAFQKLRYDRLTIAGKRQTLAAMIASVLAVLMLGYFTALPKHNLYADLTNNQRHSASAEVSAKLREIDEPITITTYVNVLGDGLGSMLPESRIADQQKFEKYLPAHRDLSFEYVYFFKKLPGERGVTQSERGLTEEQLLADRLARFRIQRDQVVAADEIAGIDLARYDHVNIRLFQTASARGVVPVQYDDRLGGPSETEMLALLNSMTASPVRVGVLQDNGERSIWSPWPTAWRRALTQIENRESAISLGLEIQAVSTADLSKPEAPHLVVIADPSDPYSPQALADIRQYIATGGDMLVAFEPSNRASSDVLDLFRVGIAPGVLVNGIAEEDWDIAFVGAAENAATVLQNPAIDLAAEMPAEFRRNLSLSTLRSAGALELNGSSDFTTRALLVADAQSTWLDASGPDAFGEVQFDARDGDERGVFTPAMSLERDVAGKNQRILIVADADFLSNGQPLSRSWIAPQVFDWLTSGKARNIVEEIHPSDRQLTVSIESLQFYQLVLGLLIPVTIALAALFVLARRARR